MFGSFLHQNQAFSISNAFAPNIVPDPVCRDLHRIRSDANIQQCLASRSLERLNLGGGPFGCRDLDLVHLVVRFNGALDFSGKRKEVGL